MRKDKNEKTAEQLKDRQDYRRTLINRRNECEEKIKRVEGEIRALRGGGDAQ